MSKHQVCRECQGSFVGPDSGVNHNLCPDCEETIYGDRDKTIETQAATITQLEEDKEELCEACKWAEHPANPETGKACICLRCRSVRNLLAQHAPQQEGATG